jgi:hypothetical protein
MERKTHRMMELDLWAAPEQWIAEAKTPQETRERKKSDSLRYCDQNGNHANLHDTRHLFISSRVRAGNWPEVCAIEADSAAG